MRRIIYAIFLTLILVVQCMTGSHKCNISGGDFTICVCTNRSGIQCSIKGISIPLNETTTKERKCLQNVHNLGQKSKTCLCSQLCHTNERVARYRDTCASQAVRTITQTFTQFVTLCCKAQRVLIELYFTLEKEAFKELLTSITSISTRTLPSYLTTTKWCRAFPLKCVELATVLQKHCKHLQNRERRNLKEETPSNTTTKQINSTSNGGELFFSSLFIVICLYKYQHPSIQFIHCSFSSMYKAKGRRYLFNIWLKLWFANERGTEAIVTPYRR